MKIPVNVVGRKMFLQTDVVSRNIPMLMSRSAMKKAAVKLDLKTDRAEIFGTEVELALSSSGHYLLPLVQKRDSRMAEKHVPTWFGPAWALNRA